MAEERTAAAESPESGKHKKRLSKVVLIAIILVVSLGGGGGVAWWVLARPTKAAAVPVDPAKQREEEIARALEEGSVVALEPFVVNLSDSDAARYLRIKVNLMLDGKSRTKEGEGEALQFKLRDVILQTLTAKSSQDLLNDDGKNALRQELQSKLEPYFKKPKLVDVMFSEFVIQL